jgi:hypothetical protein
MKERTKKIILPEPEPDIKIVIDRRQVAETPFQ